MALFLITIVTYICTNIQMRSEGSLSCCLCVYKTRVDLKVAQGSCYATKWLMTRMTRVVIKMTLEETKYFIIHRPTVRSVKPIKKKHTLVLTTTSYAVRTCKLCLESEIMWIHWLVFSASHKCRYTCKEGILKELVLSNWPVGHFLDCLLSDVEVLHPVCKVAFLGRQDKAVT